MTSDATPYGEARPTVNRRRKRGRKPGQHKDPLTISCCQAIKSIFDQQEPPLKVRQVAYQLSAHFGHLIGKDENDFEKVGRLLKMMRVDVNFHRYYPLLKLPLEHVVDGSRELHQTFTVADVEESLRLAKEQHRLNVLERADTYVVILVEKDGLLDTIRGIADEYDVPIVAQPFTSISNQFDVAKRIMGAFEARKKVVVYHLGDYDPSGKSMFMAICEGLVALLRDHLDCPEEYIDGAHEWEESDLPTERHVKFRGHKCIPRSDFCDTKVKVIRWASPMLTIERLGLIRRQVDTHCQHGLRPTKREKNTHAQRFPDNESCELDALPPNVLRDLVRRAIERHVPKSLVDRVRKEEAKQRRQIERIADGS